MLRAKFTLVLPVIAVAIAALNSSGFIFLAADKRLVDYIGCSTTYSLLVWFSHWVIPSAFSFDPVKLPEMRLFQVLIFFVGVIIFNVAFSGAIGITFTLLLAVELYFFLSALFLIYSKTVEFQLIEIVRGVLNLANLLVCIVIFKGAPAYLVAGLTLNVVVFGLISMLIGNKAPLTGIPSIGDLEISATLALVVRSRNLRFLLAARLLEITVTYSLVFLKNTETLIAVKLAVMLSQAISMNSRIFTLRLILITAMAMLTVVLLAAIVGNEFSPSLLPATLRTVTLKDLGAALVFQVPFVALLYFSLRKNRP